MRNARGFNILPEVYFSGSENVTEFLEGNDNQIKLLEIPSDLSCTYLKVHLLGRAQDWYQIFGSTLEPQVQDYVEVRNPENTVQLLEVLAKFEERCSCKAIRDSRNSDNVEERGWNERRMSSVDNNRGNWRNSEMVRRPSNGRNDYRVTTRIAVKEISSSRAGTDFRRMIEDLTIGDINLETEVKKTILVEETTEIGVRVKILVEAIEGKGDD
ncbi:uncharacterized protein TNCV_4435051 [Trichonephila clavipes]|nr:uncharacterized protein TNCV_4435051 [Trichonephila clavipes]